MSRRQRFFCAEKKQGEKKRLADACTLFFSLLFFHLLAFLPVQNAPIRLFGLDRIG
jgi:hypothetical protein